LNRTYAREIKKLKHQLRFARKPKNMKKLRKAQTRLHRIAWKIYHDLNSKLNPMPMIYIKEFDVLYRVLTQKGDDSNKVYSILEPEVLFISKGRGHKPYGLGNTFEYTKGSGIIAGAMAIEGNAYDGHTFKPHWIR
jgi:IS5 family transposase